MPDDKAGTENTGTDDTGTETEGTGTDDKTTGDTDKAGNKADDKAGSDKSGGDDGDASLGDAGKQAIDRMKRERNAAQKALKDANAKIKEYTDKDKTETQRLSETAEEAKGQAQAAQQNLRKLQAAMDQAPEGATLTQIRAVAKRLSGDSDEELEEDAKELFDLFTPSTSDKGKAPAGRPKEKLRGGGNPEEEPEETDPRKLADLIGRP